VTCNNCHFDQEYWGPDGPDLSLWGAECGRGLRYADTGAAVAAGTKAQVRKFSRGRKARGSAAAGYERQQLETA
jgi:hypothetical protein